MSIQRIINQAETLNINRRKLVSVQYTRSEIAKVNETASRNPWRLTLGISASLPYQDNRDLLEQLDYLDKTKPETVTFNQTGLNYMFAYQAGTLTQVQRDAIQVESFIGNQLKLKSLPSVASLGPQGSGSTVIFKKGDFIQIAGYPFPFTVVGPAAVSGVVTPGDVIRGTDPTFVTLTVHRPNFIAASVQNLGIKVGNEVSFRVICVNMPTYTLSPGAKNNPFIQFSGEFQLYEYTGDVL